MRALELELVAVIPSQCVLGEGPVWDDRLGCLWFVDIKRAVLWQWCDAGRGLVRVDLPERLASLGLTADPGQLVCAFASGFALLRPSTGEIDWLHRTIPPASGMRMNDGRVDRHGRFWAGSIVEDAARAPANRGSLYRLDDAHDGRAVTVLDGIMNTNSICWSPDGSRMHFADTPTQEIHVFDSDPVTGAIANRRVFARLEGNAFPDGSDVDAEGRLWNAEWGAGRVTCYEPDGRAIARLALPVSQPTCVAFGGAALDHLFVTSASEDLPAAQLAREPHAGDVLVYRGELKGLKAGRFPSGAHRIAGAAPSAGVGTPRH